MSAKTGTECVICGKEGITTRFVAAVGYVAWVCRRHKNKDN